MVKSVKKVAKKGKNQVQKKIIKEAISFHLHLFHLDNLD